MFMRASTGGDYQMRQSIIAITTLLLLGACTANIVLKNPETGELAQCSTEGHYGYFAIKQAEQCATAYQKEGWKRLTPPVAGYEYLAEPPPAE
jgi:hypothetical protein